METTINILSGIAIPIVLLIIGHWIKKSRENSEKSKLEAEALANFIDGLSSDNIDKKILALLALKHMRDNDQFPDALYEIVKSISSDDNVEVAAAAELALGNVKKVLDFELVAELLLPVKIHHERTRKLLDLWTDPKTEKPNIHIEDAMRESNEFLRKLLKRKWNLIPDELKHLFLIFFLHLRFERFLLLCYSFSN